VRGTSWSFDKPSPFETERVRDPAPDMSLVNSALAALIEVESRIEGHRDRGSLGRHDRLHARHHSRDLAGRCLPGFFLATGFSGHGFGIGRRPASSPPTS
jgi:glycine/D-amino acid oxidase-like deaminating enzyme